ncbi:MAG: hypothetical protein LBD24_09015 [Spirochaetaceae bacterium]|nr:hypothetical protein [Spirochaetaceae bacterium]
MSLSSRYPLWDAARDAYGTAGGCAKRSRASTALTRSPDKVLHRFEATGGHA